MSVCLWGGGGDGEGEGGREIGMIGRGGNILETRERQTERERERGGGGGGERERFQARMYSV